MTSPSELGVNVPKFNRRFEDDVHDIARSDFSSGLIFYVDEMSIALNADNSVSRSPLEVPFAGLLIFEVDTVSYLKSWFVSCHGLLGSCKSVLI